LDIQAPPFCFYLLLLYSIICRLRLVSASAAQPLCNEVHGRSRCGGARRLTGDNLLYCTWLYEKRTGGCVFRRWVLSLSTGLIIHRELRGLCGRGLPRIIYCNCDLSIARIEGLIINIHHTHDSGLGTAQSRVCQPVKVDTKSVVTRTSSFRFDRVSRIMSIVARYSYRCELPFDILARH
jgi:hypothetical protein